MTIMLSKDISALTISSKTPRYVLSDAIVKTSTILLGWNAARLISSSTVIEDTVVPIADFANTRNYVKQPRACRKAVKWLTLITMWALQEGLSSVLTKQIVEEHLEEFKHYISVDSATWDDFVQVFFTRHKIDGAKQFLQWYKHRRAIGRNTWFSYEELERATNKFSRALKFAEGETGILYKGIEQFSEQFIAVKRLKKVTGCSLRKLLYEVTVHHFIKKSLNYDRVPLVNLLGFCPYLSDPLLVFEYIPNGNLRQHLHGHFGKHLHSHASARLSIAIDVANALKQLHYNCESPVYHRDVKSTNILLDKGYRAKLAGLSNAQILRLKPRDTIEPEYTIVNCSDDAETVGTRGYIDPAYERSRESNDLTDVYSFGVVLMELATHLKAWDPERPVNLLTDVVKEKMKAGKLSEIVNMSGSIKPCIKPCSTPRGDCLPTMKLMLLLGVKCCTSDLKARPRIDEVEEALRKLQEQSHNNRIGLQNAAVLAAVRDNYKNLTMESMVARK